MGKTTFLLHVLRHVILDRESPCVLVTPESKAEHCVRGLLCAMSGVNAIHARTGRLAKDGRLAILKAKEQLASAPLYIEDCAAPSISDIYSCLRGMKATHGIQFCAIDTLNLLRGASVFCPREYPLELREVVWSLRAMALELDIVLLATVVHNRQCERRGDKRPILSDLSGTGALEDAADKVFLLYRPEYYDKDDSPGLAEIIVAKNRSGPTGIITVDFDKDCPRFRES